MGRKINTTILALSLILGLVGVAKAQETKPANHWHNLHTEVGFSVLGKGIGVSSPLPASILDYKGKYALSAQVLYSLHPGLGIGLDYYATAQTSSALPLNVESHYNTQYVGLAVSKVKFLPNSRFFLKGSASIGYTWLTQELKNWDEDKLFKIKNHGLGLNLNATLAYKYSIRRAIGLQFGLHATHLGKWDKPKEIEKIDVSSIGPRSLFGKKQASFLMPSIGIVWTNPLGL